MRTVTLIIALLTLASFAFPAPTAYQDIIPRPKRIDVSGEQLPVTEAGAPAATICVPLRQPKAAIGAEQINARIADLGGPELPVVECAGPADIDGAEGLPILLSVCTGPGFVRDIIDAAEVDITPDDPGDQGYIIRFLEFGGRPLVLLCGSDRQGTLYAAVTFRWLLEREGDAVMATRASVRDWPDFRWRGTGSLMQMRKSLPVYGNRGDDLVEALKQHVDWMLRAKLNLLGDYLYGGEDAMEWADADWVGEINAYARARGIIGEEYNSTNVGYDERDAGDPRFEGMMHTRNLFFTWSDDELIRKRAREIAQVWDDLNLGVAVLHCPDGGGPINPEHWNERSEADRERWGDDRASADAHVFNIFHEEIKKVAPDVQVVFVIYPYSAQYLKWEMLKPRYPDLTREQFRKASIEYWRDLGPKLPQDAVICVWLGEPQYMDTFRECFDGMPMYYWYKLASGWVDAGWLITTLRYIPTNFYDHPGDIMAVRIDRNFPNFINRLVGSQFAWDTGSTGAEDFSGNYYDFRTDNEEPEVIVEHWGERGCRHMWGAEAGPTIHQAFNKGIIPAMIVNPSRMLNDVNRHRRRVGKEPFELTPQMMLEQAEGCRAAAEALDTLVGDEALDDMDAIQEGLFVYYLRRTHCLAAYAQAHYHLLMAQKALNDGDGDAVAEQVALGKQAVEDGLADMQQLLATTAEMQAYDPKYTRHADEGVFPAIPATDADFPRMRESLEAVTRRYRDAQLDFEPVSHEGSIRVAIYDPTDDGGTAIGHQGWMLTLETAQDVEAEFIDDLSLSKLVGYEALLYPQSTSGRSVGRYEYFEVLKRYVEEAGGGVMFGHHQVGHSRAEFGMDTTFPRIGLGSIDRIDSHEVIVAAEHPITEGLSVGDSYEHVYYDHFTVKPGRRSTVILKDPGGDPVMVAGKRSGGRVIYDGQIILSDSAGAVAAEGHEREVFLNAVRWLAHRR